MSVKIIQHQPGSITVEMNGDSLSAGGEQYFLLVSDAHIDNALADRSMFE